MSRKVFYSVAQPLNRGGMGSIGWHAARALFRGGRLAAVASAEVGAAGSLRGFARGMPWPARKGLAALNRLGAHHAHDLLFDRWVANQIEKEADFYGWMNMSLASIAACRAGGGRAFVDRGSVEPRLQRKWLRDEYARFGLLLDPMSARGVERMVAEAEAADVVVVPSRLVERSYLEAGHPSEKLRVNPLGVETESFRPSEEARRDRVFRFAFVGQLSIQKGLPDLLSVWTRVAGHGASLALAGTIPALERAHIEPMLRRARRVETLGHCADVPGLLARCDALVLPSAQDGFGLVVLEAMACGLPVLVSDRVGAADCVTEGKNGRVFPFGDDDALADRLQWFFKEPARAAGMREAALETARRHSWEAYGQRLLDLTQ
ncbi:MAG: glycosyltransferase family 4 protein [Verrucomicrobiae bacterium]|nr:glycosyltransferase family 4 protein [Verrucomicrobiae bacterium]